MASISCSIQLPINSRPSSSHSTSNVLNLRNGFVGFPRKVSGSCSKPTKLGPSNGGRVNCWFRFNAETAGVYGSQTRDDYDRDDVEQACLYLPYFCFLIFFIFYLLGYFCFMLYLLHVLSVCYAVVVISSYDLMKLNSTRICSRMLIFLLMLC